MTIKLVLAATKENLLLMSPVKALTESVMSYDFKIGNNRQKLMQLCFHSLATWPLFVILILIQVIPTDFIKPLHEWLSFENAFVHFLLDGRVLNMLSIFVVFFVLEWLLRSEYFFVSLIAVLLARSEIHINLALTAVWAVYLARNCYLWWAVLDIASEVRHIWNRIQQLQFLSLCLATIVSFYYLDVLLINHLLGPKGLIDRPQFLFYAVLAFHVASHILATIWGHFYFLKEIDPSKLNTSYSTNSWILRFKISTRFRGQLKNRTTEQLKAHTERAEQFGELKKENASLARLPFEQVLLKEIEYLKEAQHRLDLI